MVTKIGKPIDPGTIATIISLVKAVWTFFGQQSAGVDPNVEKAISAVEAETGLTDDVMWAWNWFDNKYIDALGPTYFDDDWSDKDYEAALDELRRTGTVQGYDPWDSYVYYAQKHFYWWDSAHWTKMIKGTLGRIQYHLMKEVNRLAEEIGYEIQPWYIKYLPYGLMAGLGTALIIVLARRRR